jgi:uncharacterized heparinase superfamily protein
MTILTLDLFGKIRRGLKKPPRYIVERTVHELREQADRHFAPLRAARLTPDVLAKRAGYRDCDAWWAALSARPYVAQARMAREVIDRLCPGDAGAIISDAERAIGCEVDLLGSGPVALGSPIDWHRDYKTGHSWPPAFCRDIEYSNLDQPSDVKFPWELSRMQWLIPVGQAYALTGEERYAAAVRETIDDWIGANPYASSVNWSCTMDVGLRILAWTWFFHVFKASGSWSDAGFRERLLGSLYLHGDFTARHLEKSDINGNHYIADAVGLVFAGLFFGGRGEPERWMKLGWRILCDELPRQVFDDGVDFEASIPYHRLVQELFLLPALYRMKLGLDVPANYRERLLAMARFTAAYSRADGSVPLWGDADDARALPFRQKPINDHRYLLAFAGTAFSDAALIDAFSGQRSEPLWLFGADTAASLPNRAQPASAMTSTAFPAGGFYILRNAADHVFVDCGPLGLAGRGGHGHNDLLSFEAVLDGVHLVTDCGAYLYTASVTERNLFRSTAYHNTPRVDGEEINRFIRPDYLWALNNDARHKVEDLSFSERRDRLRMSHTGYQWHGTPVTVVRTIELDHFAHTLKVQDEFVGDSEHAIEIPLHLAIGVEVDIQPNAAILLAGGRRFEATWTPADAWSLEVLPARVSPTYGVVQPIKRLLWRRSGAPCSLAVQVQRTRSVLKK